MTQFAAPPAPGEVEAFIGQVVTDLSATFSGVLVNVGRKLGLYQAMADLGADRRFKTPVVRRGDFKDGMLKGDLILVARGDLCLGGRTGPDGSLLFEDNDHSYANGNPDSNTCWNANPNSGRNTDPNTNAKL